METEADAATDAAKQAVEETTTKVDSWFATRRRQAQENDVSEDEDRQRYFRERDEAMKAREKRITEKLKKAGVSLETIRLLLSKTPDEATE